MASLGLVRARRLAATADLACALSLEALQGSRTSFLPAVHAAAARTQGQARSAANVWRLLEGSAIIESHRWCDKVQDAYSLRCAPQVHGACRDLLDYVEATGRGRAQRRDRQPARARRARARSCPTGNFHGQPLAFALDALAMAVAELASISERRVERLVNPSLSEGLPPFLVEEGGLNSGFMIPQYVAAALVSENKVLAHPASVDSIPTSAGQEDHVSMGNAAGLKALQVLDNAERALAIELLAGAQAIEFLAPLEPGRGVVAARTLRAHALGAARRGPLAERGHRARRRGDPRRAAARRGRGRVRGDPLMARRARATTRAVPAASVPDTAIGTASWPPCSCVAAVTGGDVIGAAPWRACFFVVATAWSAGSSQRIRDARSAHGARTERQAGETKDGEGYADERRRRDASRRSAATSPRSGRRAGRA